jgi:hypothetical protein
MIVTGPDGMLWFTELTANKIGRFDPGAPSAGCGIGTFMEEISTPTAGSFPHDITVGPDGYIWYVEYLGNKIARVAPWSPAEATEFSIPTSSSQPYRLTTGPDGNIWFVEYLGSKIGKLHVLSAYEGWTLTATAGQRFTDVINWIHDDEPGMQATDFGVTIDWGDGTRVSTGGVSYWGDGWWDIASSHTYAAPGRYTVTMVIADNQPGGMWTYAHTYIDVAPAGAAPAGLPAPSDLIPALTFGSDVPVKRGSGWVSGPAHSPASPRGSNADGAFVPESRPAAGQAAQSPSASSQAEADAAWANGLAGLQIAPSDLIEFAVR